MVRETIVVLLSNLDPYRRRFRIFLTVVAVATIAAMTIAPLEKFTDLITGHFDRLRVSIRSIISYDFGPVWYSILALFVVSGILLAHTGRRGKIGVSARPSR